MSRSVTFWKNDFLLLRRLHFQRQQFFSFNGCLGHYSSAAQQRTIEPQPRVVSESQSSITSGDNMLEAYRHSAEMVRPKGVKGAGAGIDHILGTRVAVETNALQADKMREAWTGPLPAKNARIGKSIEVDSSRGRDLGRAFQLLSALVSRDKIKADFNKQRFHERPGTKRKRTKCERLRRKFKTGFMGTIARVQKLKSMGW